ncbi:uncharacterized protein LOC109796418 [Cajanus cajan]|uniref:uncharacterized protein LOC109796418 n=1 Tax=Cajanus cajan TaxID=3821 RepID=UPI00098D8883|nr:uncharacterized protein LOC109796418 [Cajanus cajan]
MGSPPENPDLSFPPVDIDGELNPGHDTNFHEDPISSEVSVTKYLKEQEGIQQKKKEKKKKDALQTLKSAIIVSGIVVAVAGVAFAITKKLREK